MQEKYYSLLKKNECLSDLINRGVGITPEVYIMGARLIRKMNDEEIRRERDVLRMAFSGEGKYSISIAKLEISGVYTVGVDMGKALANPGSDYDIVLREEDVIYIHTMAEAKVQEITPVYTVVEPATIPIKPSKPNKIIILIVVVFLTGVGCVG